MRVNRPRSVHLCGACLGSALHEDGSKYARVLGAWRLDSCSGIGFERLVAILSPWIAHIATASRDVRRARIAIVA